MTPPSKSFVVSVSQAGGMPAQQRRYRWVTVTQLVRVLYQESLRSMCSQVCFDGKLGLTIIGTRFRGIPATEAVGAIRGPIGLGRSGRYHCDQGEGVARVPSARAR